MGFAFVTFFGIFCAYLGWRRHIDYVHERKMTALYAATKLSLAGKQLPAAPGTHDELAEAFKEIEKEFPPR